MDDKFLEEIDLNSDLEKIYNLIGTNESIDNYKKNVELSKLNNKNYKDYYSINANQIIKLPKYFNRDKENIINLYLKLDSSKILSLDYEQASEYSKILFEIQSKIKLLESSIKTYLKEITEKNNIEQKKYNRVFFESLSISESDKNKLIEKYNDLVLHSTKIGSNLYEEALLQSDRQDKIKELKELINFKQDNENNIKMESELTKINKKIIELEKKYDSKIQYLQDLILPKSINKEKFEDFKMFYNKLLAYDDENYENAKQTYEILNDSQKFDITLKTFEEMFVEEIETKKIKDSKLNIKKDNVDNALDYIINNYKEILDQDDYNFITKLDKSDIDDLIEKRLLEIIDKIWSNTITDIDNYDSNEDYYFICSNNNFIDEIHQSILLTKKELQKVKNYKDYQIGFICEYNHNIIYSTMQSDVMNNSFQDFTNLKTPKQMEDEFVNFENCNTIALDGLITKIVSVYVINDADPSIYEKAVKIAYNYNLPLIELKK